MQVPLFVSDCFPRRPVDSHKYSVGTVAVVGGSPRFSHAPVICGLGARAAGAGLVHLVVPDASRFAAAALVPEATFLEQTENCVPPKADVTVIGMGLGVTAASERLVSRLLSGTPGCFVIDADALTLLANRYSQDPKGFPVAEGQTLILTPHVGEAARLLACKSIDIQADRNAAAQRIVAHYHALCVLKGAHTVVAAPDGRTFTCEAGNPFMGRSSGRRARRPLGLSEGSVPCRLFGGMASCRRLGCAGQRRSARRSLHCEHSREDRFAPRHP